MEWINNTRDINGEKYTSEHKYRPKIVLEDYEWFYFETTMY